MKSPFRYLIENSTKSLCQLQDLFELCFPFDTPLMVADSTLSVLELSSQDKFDRNLSNTSFKPTAINPLSSNSLGL
jgi:hypothetical protein